MRSVGLIGLGLMGVSIARRLIASGYPLKVHNRTREKAESLLQLGAQWSDSPAGLARSVDILVTMVSNDEAIDAISQGKQGFLAAMSPSKTLLEMSTLSPGKIVQLQGSVRATGASILHCPILGGPVDVYNGTATICAGGAKATYNMVNEVLEDISPTVHYVGEITRATLMKLSLNIMLTHFFLGLSSSLTFARKAKLPPYLVHDILSKIAEPVVTKLGEKILNENSGVTFSVENFEKDQRYFLEAAKELGVRLPVNEAARELAREALEKGWAGRDFSEMARLLVEETD